MKVRVRVWETRYVWTEGGELLKSIGREESGEGDGFVGSSRAVSVGSGRDGGNVSGQARGARRARRARRGKGRDAVGGDIVDP